MNKYIFKNIGAILAGFLTVFILSILTDIVLELLHIFPPTTQPNLYAEWMLAAALLYRSVYAVVGGYITALISRSMKIVWILAFIGLLFAIVGMVTNLDKGNVWYPLLLIILTIPSVWLGGKLKLKKEVKKNGRK